MLYLTKNLIYSIMNAVPASQNNRKGLEIWKKQTVVVKPSLSVGWGFRHKSRFCRETPKKTFSSHYDLLLPPNRKWSQLEAFAVARIVSLTHLSRTLIFQIYLCFLLHWKPFKNNEKCFSFHLRSSFCSQDI